MKKKNNKLTLKISKEKFKEIISILEDLSKDWGYYIDKNHFANLIKYLYKSLIQ
jgi:hypothetical protein